MDAKAEPKWSNASYNIKTYCTEHDIESHPSCIHRYGIPASGKWMVRGKAAVFASTMVAPEWYWKVDLGTYYKVWERIAATFKGGPAPEPVWEFKGIGSFHSLPLEPSSVAEAIYDVDVCRMRRLHRPVRFSRPLEKLYVMHVPPGMVSLYSSPAAFSNQVRSPRQCPRPVFGGSFLDDATGQRLLFFLLQAQTNAFDRNSREAKLIVHVRGSSAARLADNRTTGQNSRKVSL